MIQRFDTLSTKVENNIKKLDNIESNHHTDTKEN